MNDFESWMYRGAVAILLIIIWYLAKGVLKQLKEMNDLLRSIEIFNTGIKKDIENIEKENEVRDRRLNDYRDRIRDIERIQDGCPTCKESRRL